MKSDESISVSSSEKERERKDFCFFSWNFFFVIISLDGNPRKEDDHRDQREVEVFLACDDSW